MHIKGIVNGDIDILDDSVQYAICSDDKDFTILSKGHQAIKDAIFIRNGHYIEISGIMDKEKIISNRSRIDITRI
ncbi:MAG: hypothetical protein K5921_00630 [Lachnospiraceae bacterium]|nr:hypothetical protein [Lachnospiraceae bacterium]